MPRGRPRTFDTDEAIDTAMYLFWKHGYDGTSLAALSKAINVNMPSLYAAFGNKEALFAKVVDRYIEKPASYLVKAISQPTAREVAEQALQGAIDMVSEPKSADGCLLVHGALASIPGSEAVREKLNEHRARAEAAVQMRFEQAIKQGDLPAEANAKELARYLMTVIWGMSVQAAGGVRRKELEQIARMAMKSWPTT